MENTSGKWLMKSEPDEFSIEDLKKNGRAPWSGVRNFQSRNFMRDQMKVGDWILFYHSSTEPPGVAGLARVASTSYPDPSAFDRKSDYFDPKSKKDKPTWMLVDVEYVETFPRFVPLDEMKADKPLEGMMVTRRGARLSIQPVSPEHFARVLSLAGSRTKV